MFLSLRPSTALESFFLSKYSVSCLQTETGCCPWWLPLAPAEQSIQLFIWYTSRLRLCYRQPQDNSNNESFLYPYIQAINLNIRRRCGQTEIVCHHSFLMLLAPAEQSRQLLTCHISRRRQRRRRTTRQPIQILKKGVTSVCFVIDHFSCS